MGAHSRTKFAPDSQPAPGSSASGPPVWPRNRTRGWGAPFLSQRRTRAVGDLVPESCTRGGGRTPQGLQPVGTTNATRNIVSASVIDPLYRVLNLPVGATRIGGGGGGFADLWAPGASRWPRAKSLRLARAPQPHAFRDFYAEFQLCPERALAPHQPKFPCEVPEISPQTLKTQRGTARETVCAFY